MIKYIRYSRLLPIKEKFQGALNAKSGKVRSPTCEVLGAAAKNLVAQNILFGTPGY